MNEPMTKAGRWLLDRTRWDDGMRGFFVRINATAGPDDMHRHVLAIEAEATAAERARIAAAIETLEEADDPASEEFDFVNGREAWEAGRDSNRAAVIAIVEGEA